MKKLTSILSDILVGLPSGLLIFMSAMAASALLRQRGIVSKWLELLILAVSAALVGLLLRVSRKERAFSTALTSGLVGALTILLMWIYSPQNAALNPLLFGLPGIAICLLFTPLAGRC
ncbi:MAG: hypothetical protein Fur0016_13280 [Anaerolineales bacterium]